MLDEEGIDLDEFQEVLEKTLMLLKDRQPGLVTWNMLLSDLVSRLRKIL